MGGWTADGKDGITWKGTLRAENLVGNGAAITGIGAGAEADPIFSAWVIATPPLYSFTELDPTFQAASGAINAHIASGSIHFTQPSISITKSQVSDFGSPIYTELDPVYSASAAVISAHINNNSQAHSDYMLNSGDTATGNYTFDTNTLFIDATNNRVGVGTAAPFTGLTLLTDYGVSLQNRANAASRRWWVANDQFAYGDFSIQTESTAGNATPDTPRLTISNSGDVSIGGTIATAGYLVGATAGIDATIITASLGIATGSMTFTKGILTAQTQAT